MRSLRVLIGIAEVTPMGYRSDADEIAYFEPFVSVACGIALINFFIHNFGLECALVCQ